MKIFISTIVMALTFTCFAANFELAKFEQLKKAKNISQMIKYCAQSAPTAVGIENKQHFFAIRYLIGKKDTKFTKQQVLQIVKPFVNAATNDKDKAVIQFIGLQSAGLHSDSQDKAQYIYSKFKNKHPYGIIALRYYREKNYDKALELANKYDLVVVKLRLAKQTKNYDMLWDASKKILLYKKGVKNPKVATSILADMFRFKPKTVTKQQQIQVFEKLSKIYPVPGTDFKQWKQFVSFVSFRYKMLSGKALK